MDTLLDKLAPHHLGMRFFDQVADIRSDSQAYIDRFAQIYHRFRSDGASSPLVFTVLTQADNPWGKPLLAFDGKIRSLDRPGLLHGYAYEVILHAILSRVRSHLLIHAAVVTRGSQGIVVAADSHYGKTTLALELVRRGCNFLSDELAAIGRADRLAHPFPRGLRIRSNTLDLIGLPDAANRAEKWWGKLLMDVEAIRPGSVDGAAPINHIVILRDPTEESETPGATERAIAIIVDRADAPTLAAIRQIEGVTQVGLDRKSDYDVIRVTALRTTLVIPQIDAVCQERGVLVLDVIKLPERYPTFDREPRIEKISKSQAVMELLRRFQGGHHSALLREEFGGSSTRLFMELGDIIQSANCYQLNIGSLNKMADLVLDLAAA